MSRRLWSWSIAATGVQLSLTLMTSVILARTLGPEGRGVLAAVTIWAPIIAGIACLSLNDSTLYHLARSQGKEASNRLIGSALSLQILVGLAAAAILAPIVPFLMGPDRAPYAGLAVLFTAAFIPMTMIGMHQKAVAQGSFQFSTFNALRLVLPALYFVILCGFVLLDRVDWRIVVIVQVATLGLSLIPALFMSWPQKPGWSLPEIRSLVKTGLHFQAANLILYAAAEADKILVVSLMGDADVGLYIGAFAIASMGVGIVVQTLAVRLMADVSGAAEDSRPLLARRYTQAALLLLAVVNLGLAAVVPFIIPLLLGSAFQPSVLVAEILLLALFLKGVRSIIDQVMRAMHVVRAGMASEAVALAVLVCVAPFAVAASGLHGLAWTVVAAQGAALLCVSVMAARRLDVSVLDLWGFSRAGFLDLSETVRKETSRLARMLKSRR